MERSFIFCFKTTYVSISLCFVSILCCLFLPCFFTLWKRSCPWTPSTPRKFLGLTPPPPPPWNFQWPSVGGGMDIFWNHTMCIASWLKNILLLLSIWLMLHNKELCNMPFIQNFKNYRCIAAWFLFSLVMKWSLFMSTAFHVKRSRQTSGKVIVKTNSKFSPRLEIPYQVNILQGWVRDIFNSTVIIGTACG